jgi:Secretion system C-terminal sorting domain
MLKGHSFFFYFIFSCFTAAAQSPRNLTSDIIWPTGNRTASISAIQTAFNAARRAEETQLSITANALGTLTLPANFLSLSSDMQALTIINAERACRGGVNYGDGACKGWIFEGIESKVDAVAQNYANLMISSNCWGHNCGGLSPFTRIANAEGAACVEFINRGENLAVYATTGSTIPVPVVQAMYDWIYKDAGSAWGHREACFLQDRSLDGNMTNGFGDNHGPAGAEGFMGIGVATSNAYSAPFGTAYNRADLVVMDFFDPVASACSYTVLDVNLLSFNGIYKNGTNYLTWQTASEKSNAGFTIERSTDGYTFEPIGFIKGFNNSTSVKNYDFTDWTPLSNSVNYYRLAWENESSKIENSKIIAVQMSDKSAQIIAYPNPMHDVLTVKLPNVQPNTLLELTNAQGQIIATVENNAQLNVAHLGRGVYFLRAQFDGKSVVQKLVKL